MYTMTKVYFLSFVKLFFVDLINSSTAPVYTNVSENFLQALPNKIFLIPNECDSALLLFSLSKTAVYVQSW